MPRLSTEPPVLSEDYNTTPSLFSDAPLLSADTLDLIANGYTPVLGIIVVLSLLRMIFSRGISQFFAYFLTLLASFACVYLMLLAETHIQLWSRFGVTFKVEIALALALVVFLIVRISHYWFLWLLSFIGYLAILLFQEAHMILDVIMTVFAMGMIYLMLWVRRM